MSNEPISQILTRRINAMGLWRQFSAARVCAVANEVGRECRPEGSSRQSLQTASARQEFEAASFKNGVLKLRVDSGARAHLVKLREKEVVAKINTGLGREVVKRIVFDIK